MKLVNKIIFLLIFIFVVYIILIFVSPTVANNIGGSLGLEKFNKAVLNLKSKLDIASTGNFGVDEIENIYNKTLSGAKNIKDKTLETVNGVKSTIDDVRSGVDSSIKTYEEVKGKIENIKSAVDQTTKQIQEVKGSIESTLDGKNSKNQNRLEELQQNYNAE